MRDLELRGAGNLLGTEQSGHMLNIGYELYCKMLEEAVDKARGIEEIPEAEETHSICRSLRSFRNVTLKTKCSGCRCIKRSP